MDLFFWDVEPEFVLQELTTGRTKPLLCSCIGNRVKVTDAGVQTIVETGVRDDFVLKLSGVGQMTHRGRFCEMAAALLAQSLRVPVIEPAIAMITDDCASALPKLQRDAVQPSNNRHFCSRYLGPGWYTYAKGKQLEKDLVDSALCIYVFDMLIQNYDRRIDKPNVLTDGEALKAYDHELAFPFLFPIFGDVREPWHVQGLEYATRHVFFSALKGRKLDIEPCIESIKGLDGGMINQICGAIPQEWSSKDMDVVSAHVANVRENADRFADEILRVLA